MKAKKILNFLVAAVLIINQAVFLLPNTALAQIIFDSAPTTSVSIETKYILFLNFISPPAKVSESAVFNAEVSEEANVVFSILKDGAVIRHYPSIYQGNKIYYFKWDTIGLNNGQYTVKVEAEKTGYIKINRQIDVIVENISAVSMSAIKFINTPAVISESSLISAQTDGAVDSVNFYISGPQTYQTQGMYNENNIYHFKWDITNFNSGTYEIKAVAKTGDLSASSLTTIKVEKSVASEIPLEITFIESYQPPFFGEKKISTSLSHEADSVIFSIEGIRNAKYNGIKIDAKTYYFLWNTTEFPNGYYKVTANAIIGGITKASKSFSAQTENKTTASISDTDVIPIEQPLYIDIAERLISPVSGDYRITIKANQKIDKAEFYFEGPRNERLAGVKKDDYQYYIIWPTTKFPNGVYRIKIIAYQEGKTAVKIENMEVKNVSFEVKPLIVEEKPIIPQDVYLLPECKQKGIFTEEECKKFMSIPPECRDKGIINYDECGKFMSIPSECRDKKLSREECDKYMAIASECRAQGILDQEKCRNFMYKNDMPYECKKTGAKTQEECSKIIFINSLPIECQKAKATTKEECEKAMRGRKDLTPECDKANIADPDKCRQYMKENFMPEECKSAGAASQEECDYILRNKYSNLDKKIEIQTKPLNDFDYNQMPQECKDAGAGNAKECEKIMFKKYAPKECIAAGIATEEACKKFMFEKYGDQKDLPTDNLPLECQKASVTTAEECKKTMKKIYMPQECQNQNLTNEDSCQKYMELKNMPEECRLAGAKIRSECDKVMFKKYGPKECLSAGIEDEKECENYMFNKYAPQVRCDNVDDWQCKNSIQERHLGGIVSKQAQFAELKEMTQKAGETATVAELRSSLDAAKEIIPLQNDKARLRIIAVKEELVLNDSDNLIQTAPMAVMVDSDGDGLPDDMEKRVGTDPAKNDSDGDGYHDGAELKNKYNPAGEGEFKAALTAVDEAIVHNKVLGQPKTEGEETNAIAVEKIVNKEGQKENIGYSISGQAEPDSVVTLYIYSDLPLVATAKTDEYGNWQYELSDALNEGEHEIYVAVNDNTGKVLTKSKPLNFFIKEAKAVSVKDFVAPSVQTQAQKTESMLKYYILTAVLIMLVGIGLFVAYHTQRRKEIFK